MHFMQKASTQAHVNALVELFEQGSTLQDVTLYAREEFDNFPFTKKEVDQIIDVASHIHVYNRTQGK